MQLSFMDASYDHRLANLNTYLYFKLMTAKNPNAFSFMMLPPQSPAVGAHSPRLYIPFPSQWSCPYFPDHWDDALCGVQHYGPLPPASLVFSMRFGDKRPRPPSPLHEVTSSKTGKVSFIWDSWTICLMQRQTGLFSISLWVRTDGIIHRGALLYLISKLKLSSLLPPVFWVKPGPFRIRWAVCLLMALNIHLSALPR